MGCNGSKNEAITSSFRNKEKLNESTSTTIKQPATNRISKSHDFGNQIEHLINQQSASPEIFMPKLKLINRSNTDIKKYIRIVEGSTRVSDIV